MILDTSAAATAVDPNAAIAWTANLKPTIQMGMSAGAMIGRGSGEAAQLVFPPGGFVICEPEPLAPGQA